MSFQGTERPAPAVEWILEQIKRSQSSSPRGTANGAANPGGHHPANKTICPAIWGFKECSSRIPWPSLGSTAFDIKLFRDGSPSRVSHHGTDTGSAAKGPQRTFPSLVPTGSFRTQGGNQRHAKFPADTGRSNACWEAGGSRDPRSMQGTELHAGLGSGPSDLNQSFLWSPRRRAHATAAAPS